MDGPVQGPRVGIASNSENQRTLLKMLLERNALRVVVAQSCKEFPRALRPGEVDVLLLDLTGEDNTEEDLLEALLSASIPIVLNDSPATRLSAALLNGEWGKTLARKLTALANSARADTVPARMQPACLRRQAPQPVQSKHQVQSATRVWVLGASIGGPQALKRFLAALPADLPACLVLAQHIGADFIDLLAQQLAAVTRLRVLPARPGHILAHGEAVLAPVESRLLLGARGLVRFTQSADNGTFYKPSIDAVITEVAARYGARCGAILFSGMGDDGVKGARQLRAQGGEVWAQDAGSCLISGMPDQARMAGVVSYSGTPEQLAARMLEALG
jgi:chemosensory pili system protein ChpB (putative protein-glutamate methylesterase)